MEPGVLLAYHTGELEIDSAARRLVRQGVELALRPKVFDLLVFLVQNRHRVVTRDELHAALWPGVAISENSLAQCIIDLRRTLGDPGYIRTVRGSGYQFIGPVEELPQIATQPASVEISHETTYQVEYEEEHVADTHAHWRTTVIIS